MVAVIVLLTGCGGSSSSTTSTTASGKGGVSAVAACFRAGGVVAVGPKRAGPGDAVYVFTRSRHVATEGFVKAPDIKNAAVLRRAFAAAGNKIKTAGSDPTAFGFYKGTLTGRESALLSKCAS
jgi:hypothetical protein